MGGKEDRAAFVGDLFEDAPDLVLDQGIQAARRFVQDQQLWPVHEGLNETELLTVPLGVGAHLLREIEVELVHHSLQVRDFKLARPQRGKEVEIVLAAEAFVEVKFTRKVAAASSDR